MFHSDCVENALDRDKCVAMSKMRRKADLPQKICTTCGKPFAWRKKWAKVWDEVRYCSERCKSNRKAL
ncbi:MAG: hypothetical protein ACJAZ1_000522 [Yoonia sp.]|jgi:hypothetical protein